MAQWEVERIYHTIIDARDLDETVSFYQSLGFQVLHDRRDLTWPDFVGAMFGIPHARGRGVLMNLPADPSGPMLDIVEWIHPVARYPASSPSKIPRVLALRVRNVAAARAELGAKGVPFTTDIMYPQKNGSGNVVAVCCCRDPNGNVIELIELVPGARHSQDYTVSQRATQ
jgi:catechol 2,3-dioxygenase-like lactoylglutathione lyase family enzyme